MATILIQTYCPFYQINGSPKYVLKPWKHHKNAVTRPQLRPMPWVYVFLISYQVNSIEATRYKSQESQLSKRPYLPPRFRSLFLCHLHVLLHPTLHLHLLHFPSHTVYTPHLSSSCSISLHIQSTPHTPPLPIPHLQRTQYVSRL